MTDNAILDRLTTALADRYRVDRELGAGGMATVYLAHDLKHERDVAIKVAALDLRDEARDRFRREIQLAGGLTHPHILPLHDSGEVDGLLYFVMPVMQGDALRDRIVREGRLPLADTVRIGAAVADALDYAHRHGVVHRDIKPENILLHDGHAIVADFGIGKTVGAADPVSALTQAGMSLGTPAYMSPEQAAGDDVDGRADLYALGCVLYECLTGAPPFTGPTAAAVIAQRFYHTPPSVVAVRPEVPPAVAALVDRLLERELSQRPTSGAEVVRALREPLAPTVVHAPPPSAATPVRESLAVLPFSNIGGDPDSDYFSDGLTEEILTDLARVSSLRVTSRTSSMQHKGSTSALGDIARSLGVRHVLTGSVRRAGPALRINAQLVDAVEDRQLWGERFSGTLDDVFDVQERVARAITSALGMTLAPAPERALALRGVRHAAAYDLMLRARAIMWQAAGSADHWRRLLAEATAIEGPVPALRALRLWGELMLVKFGSASAQPLAQLEREADEVIAADPERALGYAVRGYVAIERGDLVTAIRSLGRAVALDPADADSRYFLMIAYAYAGMLVEAAATATEMLGRDPLSPMAWMASIVVPFFTGGIAASIAPLERALAAEPDNYGGRWTLAYALTYLGELDRARAHVDWLNAAGADLAYTAQADALFRVATGDVAGGLARADAIALDVCDCHLTFHIAEVYALAGALEPALARVALAIARGFTPMPFIGTHCRLIEPLRSLPGFAALLAEGERRTADVRSTLLEDTLS